MGKSIVCTTKGQEFAKAVPSDKLHRAKHVKPASRNRVSCREKAGPSGVRVKSERVKQKAMDTWGNDDRIPLAQVVSELVKGWFQEALKEAKAGDTNMQVLVGQMYCNGYGVPKDVQKGRAWISKASRSRSSVWKVSDKHPDLTVLGTYTALNTELLYPFYLLQCILSHASLTCCISLPMER